MDTTDTTTWPTAKHRILVLGAGYAGLMAAGRLARRLRRDDAEITVVTERHEFIERPRLHQISTGQDVRRVAVAEALAGTGVRLRFGRIERLDLAGRAVDLADGARLGYDTLVVGLGSQIDVTLVPGAAQYAALLTDSHAAEALIGRVTALAEAHAWVSVVGCGPTGVEIAAELAEQHPGVRVRLIGRSAPLGHLSERAQEYAGRVLEGFGVEHVAARVARVEPDAVVLDDGTTLRSDLTFWAAGFRPNPLVAASGLAVDDTGRAEVGRTLRSVSHPDVWVVGDAAAVPGPWGSCLAMGCRTGSFTGPAAAEAIAATLGGRRARPLHYRYTHECVSLGRGQGVVQFLRADGRPARSMLTGRAAMAYKNATLRSGLFGLRRPGPFRPRRRASVMPRAAGMAVEPVTSLETPGEMTSSWSGARETMSR